MGAVLNATRSQFRGSRAPARSVMLWWLSRSILSFVSALAVWMIWRRSIGAFSRPLSDLWLVAFAFVLVGATMLVAVPSRSSGEAAGVWKVALWIPTLAGIAASVSLPGSRPFGLMTLWFAVGGASIWIARHVLVKRERSDSRRTEHNDLFAAFASDELPQDTDQQVYRGTNDSGESVIGGRARASIQPGQKVSHVHFAFCPPLESVPDIAVELVDGPPASAKVGLLLHQGVRFDVRLADVIDEPTEIVIAFFGTYDNGQRKALD